MWPTGDTQESLSEAWKAVGVDMNVRPNPLETRTRRRLLCRYGRAVQTRTQSIAGVAPGPTLPLFGLSLMVEFYTLTVEIEVRVLEPDPYHSYPINAFKSIRHAINMLII